MRTIDRGGEAGSPPAMRPGDEERSPGGGDPPAPSAAALVDVEGLVKRYPKRGGPAVTAVDGVTFQVRRGEILGLLGPNGAGKSTTIKMICGLIRPDAGTVRVGGHDVRTERRRVLAQLAAVLEGNRNLYWRLTVRENLEYFAGNRGRSPRAVRGEIDALLERFDLVEKEREVVNALSRGMQQKLAIAVAMLAGSEVVLLDEPTLGLDVETGYEVRELLREVAASGRTVVVSTHDMPVVQDLCERAVIIDSGRVVADERVENLLRLFRSQGYGVELVRPAPPRLVERLRAAFPVVHVHDGGRLLQVDVEGGEDLYLLVDLLREHDARIQGIDRTGIHFEEVFRRVVRGESARPPRSEGGAGGGVPAGASGSAEGRVP